MDLAATDPNNKGFVSSFIWPDFGEPLLHLKTSLVIQESVIAGFWTHCVLGMFQL
jgi:hypothetical protein